MGGLGSSNAHDERESLEPFEIVDRGPLQNRTVGRVVGKLKEPTTRCWVPLPFGMLASAGVWIGRGCIQLDWPIRHRKTDSNRKKIVVGSQPVHMVTVRQALCVFLGLWGAVRGAPSIRVVHRDPTNSSYGLNARILVINHTTVVVANAGGIIRALEIPAAGAATVVWEYDNGEPVGAPAFHPATGIAAFASSRRVVAIQCATGAVAWDQPVVGFIDAAMLHVQGPYAAAFIVGAYDGTVVALEEGSGSLLWTAHAGAPIARAGAVAVTLRDAGGKLKPGIVVVTMEGTAVGISLESGEVAWTWSKPTPLLQGAFGATPAVTFAGTVLLPSVDNTIYAIDPSGPPMNGSTIWSFASQFAVDSTPALWGGLAVFGSDDQHVYGIETTTGEMVWTVVTGDWVQCSPVVSALGIAWIGSNDGVLYGLNASTGAILAQANPSNATIEASAILWTPHGAKERLVPQGSGVARPAIVWGASEGAGESEPPQPPGAFEQGSTLDQWAHVIATPAILQDGTVVAATTRGVIAAVSV